MSEWASYRLQDFIPFTSDIYFRLLERMGEAFWPLQLLTLAVGGAALFLAKKNRARPACLLVAAVWAFVGVAFFMQRYAELNWAGGYVGYAFLVQAAIPFLIGLIGRGMDESQYCKSPPVVAGTVIALFGLIAQPLFAPLSGGSWFQAEVFGIHPDPTAIVTLGVTLIALRGVLMWAAAIIPILWILISILTLLVLDASKTVPLLAVLVVGVTCLMWKSIAPLPGSPKH